MGVDSGIDHIPLDCCAFTEKKASTTKVRTKDAAEDKNVGAKSGVEKSSKEPKSSRKKEKED